MFDKSEFGSSVFRSSFPTAKEFFSAFPDYMPQNISASDVSGDGLRVFPGFCDVHVHFRQPGFSYKETIASGCKAAARGGFTDVCTMPNLSPVPDCPENLVVETEAIDRDATIGVHPYGAITIGQRGEETADLAALAATGRVIAFSDDGRGVQNADTMREAMRTAASLGKMIVAHCEVNELLRGGYVHDGEYARAHGHRGICSESEYAQIARDLELVAETGAAYHVCHISAKESVALIRQAKASGLNVTCETAPHYLVLDDGDLCESGNFKMNPPLRSRSDREALVEGVCDGTVDMIATDHAPHSLEEKSRGLEGSLFGIVGLETAFPVCYTHLVRRKTITLERLIDLMSYAPRKRFGIPCDPHDVCIWQLDGEFTVNPDDFLSKGRATPFVGHRLYGISRLTLKNGKTVYNNFKNDRKTDI